MRTVSAALEAAMVSLGGQIAATLTAERWLPKWTAKVSGLSAGELEAYAHGHAAAAAVDANGAGEDIVFRARSGSYANPQDGKLYISIIKGADLAAPGDWDDLWTDTGVTGLMYPAWTADSGAAYGGSIAAAVWNNGGVWTGRVFYALAASGAIYHRDYNLATGAAIGGAVSVTTPGTGNLASMQFACCSQGQDELFVLVTEQVEASQAAWQKNLYGSNVKHYTEAGGVWSLDSYSFPYHTCLEGHAVKDSIDYDAASTETVAQWGKRPCGGLAVNEVDANTVVVSFGGIHWRRRGYWTNNAGLRSFIYHRDSGWWEPGAEVDKADFVAGQRLKLPMFARGCLVDGVNVVTWARLVEPADFQQTEATPVLARLREVVWARLSAEGRCFSHFERLGDQEELTAAGMVQVNHAGGQKLYALGWRSVYESEMAAAVGTVDYPLDLGGYATNWGIDWDNKLGMRLDANLADPTLVYDETLERGMLVRASLGIPGDQIQVGQGLIDQLVPVAQAEEQLTEWAGMYARADKALQDTVSETLGDELAHTQIYIAPTNPIKHVAASRGLWAVEAMTWPELFFAGDYTSLNNTLAYRLKSFPYAVPTTDNPNNPGKCLTNRKEYMGTWFKDIVWLGLPPRVEGAIEATARFGDVNNATVAGFKTTTNINVYAVPQRANGVITALNWYDGGGNLFNSPAQSAVMAGLICHAPEVGRKYSFIWEYGTPLSSYSHVEDTQRSVETFDNASVSHTGTNLLYLIQSDYSSSSWVHKEVAYCSATGLTRGRPADMRMQVVGGTIYCFYRPHATDAQIAAGTQPQWRLAFSWKTGRFGASQFGLVGRGQAGIQWDIFTPGAEQIKKCENYVDFFNIKLSDAVIDRTMEEQLWRKCWQGWTDTTFTATVDDAGPRTVNAGAYYSYGLAAINPVLDFKVNIPANGNEAGVFVRGASLGAPTDTCMKIGLVAHSTSNVGGSEVNYYVVKRRYSGGSEVVSAREYAPLPLKIAPGVPIPVRVTARGSVYAVWIAGNFAGHFRDSTALGLYFGLYATGGNAQFSAVYMPELYEVPIFAPMQVNQTMAAAVQQVLSGRRIKAVFQADGSIKFSYFLTHPTGPSFEDTLARSNYQTNDRFLSVVRVDGAYTWAEFASAVMLAKGRHFAAVHNPDIAHYEFAYREAQAILTETAERQVEAAFDGLPDVRVEPEDQVTVAVAQQGVAGDFLVDDVRLRVNPESNEFTMSLGTRAVVVL